MIGHGTPLDGVAGTENQSFIDLSLKQGSRHDLEGPGSVEEAANKEIVHSGTDRAWGGFVQ